MKGVRVGHAFETSDSLLLSSSILRDPTDFIDSLESVNSEVLTQRLDFSKSGNQVVIPFPDWFQKKLRRHLPEIKWLESLGVAPISSEIMEDWVAAIFETAFVI